MYLDALEFLEDEREAWRPFEALADLPDADLSEPRTHGWSGRDLMAHLTFWQEVALNVAKELALRETSPLKVQSDADWDARGDAINEEIRVAALALPLDEVRARFRQIPGELRGYLTVVPETRWLKNSEYEQFFLDETTDHYAAHADDLAAVLGAPSGSLPA